MWARSSLWPSSSRTSSTYSGPIPSRTVRLSVSGATSSSSAICWRWWSCWACWYSRRWRTTTSRLRKSTGPSMRWLWKSSGKRATTLPVMKSGKMRNPRVRNPRTASRSIRMVRAASVWRIPLQPPETWRKTVSLPPSPISASRAKLPKWRVLRRTCRMR